MRQDSHRGSAIRWILLVEADPGTHGAEEWEQEWLYTNELPVMAHVTLSFQHGERKYENHKLIALASSAVPKEFQLGVAGRGGARGSGGRDPRDGGARSRGDSP